MIHIYCGDGKGKTTAAMGLALRSAGAGIPVLIVQFLKDGGSGEIRILKKLSGIRVWCPEVFYGFTESMTLDQQEEMKGIYGRLLEQVRQEVCAPKDTETYRLLVVLDEVIYACAKGLLEEEALCDLLDDCPFNVEIVLTGRDPSEALTDRAHYISEIQKKKHPFDQGAAAREGIEM